MRRFGKGEHLPGLTCRQGLLSPAHVLQRQLFLLVSAERRQRDIFRSQQEDSVSHRPCYRPGCPLVNGCSNSALYWGAQMFGGFAGGAICDLTLTSRPRRPMVSWAFLFLVETRSWAAAWRSKIFAVIARLISSISTRADTPAR